MQANRWAALRLAPTYRDCDNPCGFGYNSQRRRLTCEPKALRENRDDLI